MVGIVDVKNDPGDLTALVADLTASAAARTATPASDKPAEQSDKPERPDWCPEKFWDAESGTAQVEKLAQSYQNLQRAHGQMANDLGVQRKLTDQFIRPAAPQQPEPPKRELPRVTSAELLEKPNETLERVLAADRVAMREESDRLAAQQEAELAAEQFATRHPDAMEVTADPNFASWVQKSPLRVRAAMAAQKGDVNAASALLDDFKQTSTRQPPKADADALEAARKASLERPSSGTSGTGEGKKIWRRVDIINLKLHKPDTYKDPQVQAEIMAAYAEGRVK